MADLQFSATVRERGLDASFTVRAGEVLALVGPNGAGKSTAASVIAGLLPADRAVVRVGDRTLTDTGCGVFVPVRQRRVGVLLQEPLLFPHLSVLGNVQFAAGRGTAGRHRALDWLGRVGAADLAACRPAELSGGQAQRVALARALAAEPDALLLDEPLNGLDVSAAAAVRAQLRAVLTGDGRAALLITHDVLDVLGLADRIAVLEAGRIVQTGPVTEVLAAPQTDFVARMAGLNAVRGVAGGPGVLRSGGSVWHGVAAEPLQPGDHAVAVFSPASVAVYRERPHGSPRNCIDVQISALEVTGAAVRVRTSAMPDDRAVIVADITAEAVAELRLSVGESVWLSVKTQEVSLHAAGGA